MRELKIDRSITERDSGSVDRYMSEIGKIPLLSIDEEVKLSIKAREGDQLALERLVRTNLRFVVSVAKKYQYRGLSLGDLINEGNVGLIKAASRFDPTKGFKFISFAVWWIRQSIMLAITEQTRLVRLPHNVINSISRINKASSGLEQRLERFPTVKEIADDICSQDTKVYAFLKHARKVTSLDVPAHPDTDCNLNGILISEHPGPEYQLMLEDQTNEVTQLLKSLQKKEEAVLRMYFGLGGSEPRSLDDIAALIELSRERVRQIKDDSLQKLRSKMKNINTNMVS